MELAAGRVRCSKVPNDTIACFFKLHFVSTVRCLQCSLLQTDIEISLLAENSFLLRYIKLFPVERVKFYYQGSP